MGSFYTNVVTFGVNKDAIAAVCARPAFLAEGDGFVVVFAERDEDGADPEEGGLSSALACTTLTVTVHDSDLLVVLVHTLGELIVQGCVPDPAEYFGGESEGAFAPTGAELVAAIGCGDPDSVDGCLRDEQADADDRHEALLAALGLPTWSARFGYRYLAAGEAGYEGPQLTHLS